MCKDILCLICYNMTRKNGFKVIREACILTHYIVIPAFFCMTIWSIDGFISLWILLTIIIAFKSHQFLIFLFFFFSLYRIDNLHHKNSKPSKLSSSPSLWFSYLHTAMQTNNRMGQSQPRALVKTTVMFLKSSAVLLADWEVPEHSTSTLTV